MSREDLAKALVVTAEVMGSELSVAAAEVMARQLAQHDKRAVWAALQRCQRELTGRLSLARVLERMPGQHIGAEEAWALCPMSEADTVVWTDEIASAYAAAKPLLDAGDHVAARMAFVETYKRVVAMAMGQQPKWWPSLGHDTSKRVQAVRQAVEHGRLTAERAESLVGGLLESQEPRLRLVAETSEPVDAAQLMASLHSELARRKAGSE